MKTIRVARLTSLSLAMLLVGPSIIQHVPAPIREALPSTIRGLNPVVRASGGCSMYVAADHNFGLTLHWDGEPWASEERRVVFAWAGVEGEEDSQQSGGLPCSAGEIWYLYAWEQRWEGPWMPWPTMGNGHGSHYCGAANDPAC